jgi:hypothetical protein
MIIFVSKVQQLGKSPAIFNKPISGNGCMLLVSSYGDAITALQVI